jgi:hypothetical protein
MFSWPGGIVVIIIIVAGDIIIAAGGIVVPDIAGETAGVIAFAVDAVGKYIH